MRKVMGQKVKSRYISERSERLQRINLGCGKTSEVCYLLRRKFHCLKLLRSLPQLPNRLVSPSLFRIRPNLFRITLRHCRIGPSLFRITLG